MPAHRGAARRAAAERRAGWRELADDGPAALADRRLGPASRAARRAARDAAPGAGGRGRDPRRRRVAVGGAGAGGRRGAAGRQRRRALAARCRSWASGCRPRSARAGLPDGLLQVLPASRRRRARAPPAIGPSRRGLTGPKGAMLVLDGAPLERRGQRARCGRRSPRAGHGPASVGRVVRPAGRRRRCCGASTAGAERLQVGDPADPETEVGPLRRRGAGGRGRGARARGGGRRRRAAVRRAAGRRRRLRPGRAARASPPDARLLREPVPGPVLAVLEAGSEADAIGARPAGTARRPSRSGPPTAATASASPARSAPS